MNHRGIETRLRKLETQRNPPLLFETTVSDDGEVIERIVRRYRDGSRGGCVEFPAEADPDEWDRSVAPLRERPAGRANGRQGTTDGNDSTTAGRAAYNSQPRLRKGAS